MREDKPLYATPDDDREPGGNVLPVLDGTALVDQVAEALALLAAALVLSMTTWFSATAVVPQLRAEWDLGNTAAAWLTIAVQVGSSQAHSPGARSAWRTSSRPGS